MSGLKARRSLRAWGRRQLYSFFSSLGTLLGHRLGTAMTVLVLGIAMALPLGLFVAVKNLSGLDFEQDRLGTITVFLKAGTRQEDARALLQSTLDQGGVEARLVSPEEGLAEFREASEFGRALEILDENPLPWVLLVTPGDLAGAELGSRVAELSGWLGRQADVDNVQVDFKWLQRLSGLLSLGRSLATLLAVLFSLAVVVVVANTIRLDVAARAEEIQVLSLVGAGNSFIRQPFLYSGFWYGLLGALLALFFLYLSLLFIDAPLERLLASYGNTFEIRGLGAGGMAAVVMGGSLLGFLGALLSVQRYLRELRESGGLGRR